jgi:cobalt-zinc-cadmium efflux system protein
MTMTQPALTARLIRPGAALDDAMLRNRRASLRDRLGIDHTTIHVETGEVDCGWRLAGVESE